MKRGIKREDWGMSWRIEVRAGPIALDTRSAAVQSSFSQAEIVTLPRASKNLPVVLLEPVCEI